MIIFGTDSNACFWHKWLNHKPDFSNPTSLHFDMAIDDDRPLAFEKKRIWLVMIPPIVFVVILWLVAVVNEAGLQPDGLGRWGILPRHFGGLAGILFSPFIHGSFSHLLSNTLPLLVLLWCTFYFYREIAYRVVAILWLSSGFITWLIGRDSYHLGASGLVFALFSFLFFSGIFRKYIPLISVSLLVAFIYGSSIWSIFPVAEYVDAEISWEGHLSGFIGGLFAAVIFRKRGPQKPPEEEAFLNEGEVLHMDNEDMHPE